MKTKRLFYRKLKQIQNEHKPPKGTARHPYNWKKEWGPFLKYDADWDGAYLIELIIYKLEKMYLHLDLYSNEIREDLDKRLVVLRETIDLGKKVQNFDYYEDSYNWGVLHCAHVAHVEKKGSSEEIHKIVKWKKDLPNEEMFHFYYDVRGEIKNWAREHGYRMEDLNISYSGEWDSPRNYEIYKEKMNIGVKQMQNDTEKFFKLIAENYQTWWW